MVTFAIQVAHSLKTQSFFAKAHERLQHPDFIRSPYRGGIKETGKGLYVVDIEPLYPRFLLLMFSSMFFIAAIVLYTIGFYQMATALLLTGLVLFSVVNVFYTPFFYQAVFWVQLYRLTGGWQRVQRADNIVLRRIVYGAR